jgi:profilin
MKSKDFSSFQAGGIHCEGVKYQFLREEDGKIVFGKKKDEGALTMQSSKTAVVIGHTKEGGQQGNTNKGVAVIAEYLESLGM